jgi:glutamate-ammonia-ligase adenylyltransferase
MRGVDAAPRLLSLARTIDPERARSALAELGPKPDRALAVLLSTAFPPLTPGAGHQVDALSRFSREGLRVERRRRDLLRDARRLTEKAKDSDAFLRFLRRFVWAERARIALRELLPIELGGAPIEATARELSNLADVALELSLDEARAQIGARFGDPRRSDGKLSTLCAFGMGKLGGLELNAGSDVDLLFVYDSDDGAEQSELPLHDHWSRVVRRAVSSIDTPSEDGLIWRVDLRLRPEGSGGPLANSVAATERYYETWGRLWERAALLRARPMAGDLELGRLVAREIFTPFVYRHAVEPALAQGLCELVERSRRELSSDPERDLKLGRGGIREAEFFVQALQLIWGGREPTLRVAGTRAALSRLESRGLVSDREARIIGEGYTFLRRIEHRVQWMSGVQTHLLPSSAEDLARLGRTLGYTDERPLLAELARIRGAVAELFTAITPGTRRRSQSSRFDYVLAVLSDPNAATVEAERAFGSGEIAEHLIALARRPDGLLGEVTRDRFPNLGRDLLEELAASPDPELASRTMRAFFARFPAPGAYVTALAEGERALARFVTVLGSSSFVGEALVARPELADVVLFGEGKVSDPRAAVASELEVQPSAATPSDDDEGEAQDRFVAALRLTKRRVMVEVAVADLAGSIGTREATRLLSELADELLRQVVNSVCVGDTRGLSVIALGKLGGRELGYGSDLDVIFVFDPSTAPSYEEAFGFFTRRAQRILRVLSEPSFAGPGYELDTRLRPSGSQGMLVTSLGAFARYHGVDTAEAREYASSATSSGAAWERQALLRARLCAGDRELGARVLAIAHEAAYHGGAPPVEELTRMRQRMQLELARERPGHYDLKVGKGGLLDIEFCVQWLQMRHGDDLSVRTTDTGEALEALHAAGHLNRRLFDLLRDGYRFLRRLEQRIHVLTGQSSSRIDADSPSLPQLARRMGLQDEPGGSAAQQLLARYETLTANVHTAYLEALGTGEE